MAENKPVPEGLFWTSKSGDLQLVRKGDTLFMVIFGESQVFTDYQSLTRAFWTELVRRGLSNDEALREGIEGSIRAELEKDDVDGGELGWKLEVMGDLDALIDALEDEDNNTD